MGAYDVFWSLVLLACATISFIVGLKPTGSFKSVFIMSLKLKWDFKSALISLLFVPVAFVLLLIVTCTIVCTESCGVFEFQGSTAFEFSVGLFVLYISIHVPFVLGVLIGTPFNAYKNKKRKKALEQVEKWRREDEMQRNKRIKEEERKKRREYIDSLIIPHMEKYRYFTSEKRRDEYYRLSDGFLEIQQVKRELETSAKKLLDQISKTQRSINNQADALGRYHAESNAHMIGVTNDNMRRDSLTLSEYQEKLSQIESNKNRYDDFLLNKALESRALLNVIDEKGEVGNYPDYKDNSKFTDDCIGRFNNF